MAFRRAPFFVPGEIDVLPRRYLATVSIWAPVVAALGASFLTGVLGFGTIFWQQRRRDRADAVAQKRNAYGLLIAHSLNFTIRAQAMRNTMRARSGFNERLDLAMRLRRPLDPIELHDWFAQGYEPLNQAWANVEVVGSAAAVRIATDLMDTCADFVKLAGELGMARGRFVTYLRGFEWTADQDRALEEAARRVLGHRRAFIALARTELGQDQALRFDAAAQQTSDDAATA